MKKTQIYMLLLTILGITFSIWAYPRLPDQVAIHWSFDGKVDGYSSKLPAVLAFPIISTAAMILLTVLPKLDPRRENYTKFQGSYYIMMNSTFTFLLFTHTLIILHALGYPVSIETAVPIGVGILFVIMGNYMQRVKSNYFIGIRTPWALQDEDVWKATHRLGARMFVIAGLLMIIAGLLPNAWKFPLFIGAIVLAAGVPFVASYLFYRKKYMV